MKRTRDGQASVHNELGTRQRVLRELQVLVSPLFFASLHPQSTATLLELLASLRQTVPD